MESSQENANVLSRPEKVSLAVRLLYIYLGISLVAILAQATQAPESLMLFFVIIPLVTMGIMFWLVYMIGKGRNWARIIYLVLLILSIPTLFTTVSNLFKTPTFQGFLGIAGYILNIVALVFLFQTASSDWFREMKGK